MVIALRAFPAAIADLKAATSVAGEGAGSIVVLAGEPKKMESSALDSVRWDEGIFWRGATPDVTPPTHSHTGWTVLTDAIASVVFAVLEGNASARARRPKI
jgi:hypothetical protein